MLGEHFSPAFVKKLFSGEIDGHVTKYPFSSLINQSIKMIAAHFIVGYTSSKKLLS